MRPKKVKSNERGTIFLQLLGRQYSQSFRYPSNSRPIRRIDEISHQSLEDQQRRQESFSSCDNTSFSGEKTNLTSFSGDKTNLSNTANGFQSPNKSPGANRRFQRFRHTHRSMRVGTTGL